jgi:restriction system protein
MIMTAEPIVRAPLYPTYTDLGHALRAFDGVKKQTIRNMITAIHDQTGTPQNPVDWTDPDRWIDERLSGDQRDLARTIWIDSGKTLNPRHVYGCHLFINRNRLTEDVGGISKISAKGQAFLNKDETLLRRLDSAEGLPKLLSMVAEQSPCKRGDLLPAWGEYLSAVSKFTTAGTFADTLSRRLFHLTERGLIQRSGNSYSISDAGLDWLKGFDVAVHDQNRARSTNVIDVVRAYNSLQKQALRDRLLALTPFQFEHFVKALLEAMEYVDVKVTKASGDLGVDVAAKIQFGITEITEVVQVKRTETTINRTTVDALRGALPYHKALRGTIVSLGKFTKGAQEGATFVSAAPITLIDGEHLLDLCIKHQVGIKHKPVDVHEIDDAFFNAKFTDENGAELLDQD